jgi:hypothetical protein
VVATGSVPTWSAVEGGGTFTRAQSRESWKLLPQLGRLVGALAAGPVLYLLTTSVAAVSTFVLMRRMASASVFFALAAAYVYANISFEQLAFAPEYAVWMLTPIILLVFGVVVPGIHAGSTKALAVVALSLLVAFVGDFARQTVWILVPLTPVILLFARSFKWAVAGWWLLFVVLTGLSGARVVFTILATNPFSDRAHFVFYTDQGFAALLLEWLRNVCNLAREHLVFLLVTGVFLGVTTYLKEYEVRKRVTRHILLAVALLLLIDLMVWLVVWGAGDRGGPAVRSLSMRTQTVLWAYLPLATFLIAGHLPRDLAITAGRRWVIGASTAVAIGVLATGIWLHAARLKTTAGAWLNGETIGGVLRDEPLRRLRAEDPGVFRVATVQSLSLGDNDLKPGHLMYYGFETADSVFSNQLHVHRQFWSMLLSPPMSGTGMALYLIAPVSADGVRFDRHFRLPLLSLMNTKYVVSRAPISSASGRLVAVHTPAVTAQATTGLSAGRAGAALQRNLNGGTLHVYRNADAFERAFTVSGVRSFADEAALLRALGSASIAELRENVFVLAPTAERLGALNRDAGARVTLDRYGGWFLEMAVISRGATALVISQTVGPWWRCRSGTATLETFPAYHAWLGVRLPAGDHRVRCAIDLAKWDLLGAAH